MEGPPDAKRPRLDHEHSSYPVAPLARPATTPATAPQSHPYSDHPQSVPPNHSYQPPPSGPPPPTVHPTAPGPRSSFSRDPGPDPRGPQGYPPPTTQPGFHEQPNGYAAVNHTHRSRSFSTDPPTSASTQPTPAEQRGHQQPPAASERMELHGQAPHVYQQQQQQQLEQHPNHQVPNGLPYQPQEPYPHGYAQSPVTAYGPAHPFGPPGQGPSTYGTGAAKRKQVRATQACNNCRQRKQKCDEQKPCSYCKNENIECEYREVPIPKTDRAMQDLISKQQQTADDVLVTKNDVNITKKAVSGIEKQLQDMAWTIMDLKQTILNSGTPAPGVNGDRKIALGELSDTASTARPRSTTAQGEYPMPPQSYGNYYQNDRIDIPAEMATSTPITLTRPRGGLVELQQSRPRAYEDLNQDHPGSHETGAQYLINWPIIQVFFEKAGVKRKEYVQEEEEKQDTLRPYGSSWVPDYDDQVHTPMSPPQSAEAEHVPMWSPPKEGSWGTDFNRSNQMHTNIGGLNPDGSLCLDEHVVKELWDSYMQNMWIMHPFIDAQELKEWITNFVRKHSPTGHRSRQSPSTRFAVPNSPISAKRKHPDDEAPSWRPPTMTPERSMENAIVLLVLALGRVLQEEGFLLQNPPAPTSTPHSYHSSPRVYSSPRPHVAGSPAGGMGRTSTGQEKSHSNARPKVRRRHIDMYPGLAYFAYASDIMGNNHGGNQIIHAQAFLLTGLYLGQLGRVLESWTWIYDCFRVATLLRSRNSAELYDPNDPDAQDTGRPALNNECTIISLLCWSALQLESDLRAELESLPKPGALMFTEPTVRRPTRLVGMGLNTPFETIPGQPPIDPEEVMWHYSTQIQLRLTLNRVHSALYKSSDARQQIRSTPWADSDASGLFMALQTHRQVINGSKYGWRDGDPPPKDLLHARLRAKFYGAAYIILRPYIFNALKWHDEGIYYSPDQLRDWLDKSYNPFVEPLQLPQKHLRPNELEKDTELARNFLWCCKKSIDSAMNSTIAFDGVADPEDRERMRVTNIHGTATAQFSNMLVLTAVYKSWLHPFVKVEELRRLMERTMCLHRFLRPLAPIFQINLNVLRVANEALKGQPGPTLQSIHQHASSLRWPAHGNQGSPHSMHESQSSTHSPALPSPITQSPAGNSQYGHPPGPTSAHNSFGSH